jgi:imidazolonepropionase-like amidohydrolase
VLDGKSETAITNAVILLEGDRIKAVGPGLEIPAGAQVLDLGSATVLPGLIDCHTHLLTNFNGAFREDENAVFEVARNTTTFRALRGSALGREDLESGLTTVRDLGNSGMNGDVALRDAINAGC